MRRFKHGVPESAGAGALLAQESREGVAEEAGAYTARMRPRQASAAVATTTRARRLLLLLLLPAAVQACQDIPNLIACPIILHSYQDRSTGRA